MPVDLKDGKKPLILLVDDILRNLQVLGQILYNEGYEITLAESGNAALSILERITPDIILLDIAMPFMDGYEVCRKIKSNPLTRNIPVIFVTAKTEPDDLVEAFESGGVDYITKPFNRKELLARVKTHLELKVSREIIERNAEDLNEMNSQLVSSNAAKDDYLRIINNELSSAAEYVQAILSKPLDDEYVKTDWRFIPSSQLGGDSFGYHWIDDEHFAMYLLDVSGHGVRPALHSVFVLSVLRFQTLRNTDYKDPSHVLEELNKSFQMTDHKDLYFTLWYGVYNKNTGSLKYAGAGHPPALLVSEDGKARKLSTPNYGIGLFPFIQKNVDNVSIDEPSCLYIFSDGAYEVKKTDGLPWTLEELYEFLETHRSFDASEIDKLYSHILEISGSDILEDDFSMLKIFFKK